MKFLGLFIFFISISSVSASTTITSKIYDIDHGTKLGDEVLIFLTTGQVVKASPGQLEMVEAMQSAKGENDWFTFTLDDQRYIKSLAPADSPYPETSSETKGFESIEGNEQPYVPTTVASMQKATSYIAESRRPVTTRVTQCFNRAMVWVYEWWRKHSLRSQKVFIFWPKAYVRKYSHEWWFHVAPYVHVMDSDGIVKERVLDVKWLSKPYSFQDWADYHSPKDVKCKVVEKYSDQANYPWDTEHCYFIRSHMYSWQPMDLELYESWPNYSKNAFNMDEVRSAYLEAFDVTL